jgi:hypothetical protein
LGLLGINYGFKVEDRRFLLKGGSRCGSMSLVEKRLWEELAKKPGVKVIDLFTPGLKPEESYARLRQGLLAGATKIDKGGHAGPPRH